MADKPKDRRSIKDLQIRLAEYLISFERGQHLPSIRSLAASTHMSVGSVSTALNGLQDIGAVKIEKRGHLGSVVVSLSLGELWNLVERDPLVIAMTLPMHRRFEGLATGVKMAMERAGIAAYMIFIRGSRTRLKALQENRCHVAIMSGLAADELCTGEQETLLKLPPGSWVGDYSIFYRVSRMEDSRSLRVAVDPDSFDHKRLTELEFSGQEVVYRSAPFVQFPRLLNNGDVDAILWTSDQEESFSGEGIRHRPLSGQAMDLVGEKSVSAAFIARKGNEVVRVILQATVKAEEIMEIQKRVVSGELIPEY
ncbi:MAG TPA: YhfZ family protein [Anaerolineales bacterium]|nr:YhfZ family protein [Anaerolineales bacterium]